MSACDLENDNSSNLQSSAGPGTKLPLISIVTPAYNEEKNLPVLYAQLSDVMAATDVRWEWLVVDDNSSDSTFDTLKKLAVSDSRIRVIRFARNFGSHCAVTCGLNFCKGDCATVIAADLQDPPETIPALLERWQSGFQIVWAARSGREGETKLAIGFAKLYYLIMRRIVGIKQMPATGADFFVIDRCVIAEVNRFRESHVSLFALITWMGFRQSTIYYDKQARLHGKSGWTFRAKIELLLDSVTSFSYLPIRLMSYFGGVVALLGFAYSSFIIRNSFVGNPIEGWSSLMVVVAVLGGIQMLMMGVLGEYLWRALDEARQRPRYIIEAQINNDDDD